MHTHIVSSDFKHRRAAPRSCRVVDQQSSGDNNDDDSHEDDNDGDEKDGTDDHEQRR